LFFLSFLSLLYFVRPSNTPLLSRTNVLITLFSNTLSPCPSPRAVFLNLFKPKDQ
jgi:hypothetical protein